MRVDSPLVLAIGRLQRVAPSTAAPGPEPLRGLRGTDDGVRVTLSADAREASGARDAGSTQAAPEVGPTRELDPEEKRQVAELSRRDREVRAHEAAHKGAAGGLARGGATYKYETGPDGKRYAVGGEVSIDASPISGDPAATARKMRQVQRAALAPAEPSGQDRKVAANAAREAQAATLEAIQATGESALGAGEEPAASIEPWGAQSSGISGTSGATEAEPAATSCPECGGQGHGPEAHNAPVDVRA